MKQQQQISAIKQYFVSRSTSATAFSIPYTSNDTTTTFTASSPRPSSSPHNLHPHHRSPAIITDSFGFTISSISFSSSRSSLLQAIVPS
ncbi:hypothetical protein TWF103_001848 [Orbilia oligospora]|nr:hypothetical protein TWF103_001848 [Orbilia oligospora]